MKNKYILVTGNISSGKTTFANNLGNILDFQVYLEPFQDNPYLHKFYNNMKEWSFKSQIYFLSQHLKQHLEIANMTDLNIIKDCSIYESVEIFGKNMYNNGDMSKEDWETYYSLYRHVLSIIRKPDLIIKLECPIEILIERINKRGREMENKVTKEYLTDLNYLYNQWISSVDFAPVIRINNNSGEDNIKHSIQEKIMEFIY